MANTKAVGKRTALNVQIKSDDRSLIDRAALVRGKNAVDFVLDAARSAAEEVLLHQSPIVVTPKVYAEFLEKLDAPAHPNERLRKTIETPPPWKDA